MPDEEIVIRTRLEDGGVVAGLEQQARAVADLRRRAGAGGTGAPVAPDWMGAPPGLAQFKTQADAAIARAAQIQRDITAREARAVTEQAARTSQVGSALSGASTAARLTGNWQMSSALDAIGGLATRLGGAGLAALGVAAGVAALGVAAGKAMWNLGELALKVDTLAREGQNAKTSIEQYALAQERIRLGLGRYAAPTVNAFYTQAAAAAATVAGAVGNQTPDDAVQNALARERAAQQRLEAARKTWGATPPAVQAEAQQLTYAQMGRYGMGMGINPFSGLAATVPQAEAAAAAETTARLQAQLAQAQAALAAIQAGGGGPQTRAETGAFLTQQIAAKEKDVALIKEEVAQYQELARQISLAAQKGDAGLAQRLSEQFKTINADKLLQALKDAENALRDLTGRKYVLDIEGAIRMPTQAEIQAGLSRANLSIFDPSRMADWGPYAQGVGAPGSTYNSLLGPSAPPEPLVPFNIAGAGIGDVGAYSLYQTGKANQGTAGLIAAAAASAETTRSLAARDYVKPSDKIGKLESTLRGLIGQGPSTAVGLGDLRGGTYGGGPLAPGAGGAFEALFRIQDVAQNWDTPGKDTKKWAEMYGVDKEQAKGISKQFQMGFFSPEVMKYVDTQSLVDTANMMDLADKSQEALAKELAKKGANPANIKRLLGVVGKDDKDTTQYKPAIDTMLGGLGTELGNQAGNVEAVGKKWWGMLEKGLTDGAKDSDVLLNILRSLIRQELNAAVPVQ